MTFEARYLRKNLSNYQIFLLHRLFDELKGFDLRRESWGYFGDQTEAALRQFQRRFKIQQTREVDKETLAVIQRVWDEAGINAHLDYHLKIRLIAGDSKQPLEHLTVEVWDQERRSRNSDRIGIAQNKGKGRYELTFTEEEFMDDLTDYLLDPFFRIKDGSQLVLDTRKETQRGLLPGQHEFALSLFGLYGKVIDKDRKPLENYTIKAYRKTIGNETEIGIGRTDSKGQYRLYYKFDQQSNKKSYNIVLRAFLPGRDQAVFVSALIMTPAPWQRFNILVKTIQETFQARGQYEMVDQRLGPLLNQAKKSSRAKKFSPARLIRLHDVSMMAKETRIYGDKIIRYLEANELASRLGVNNTEIVYGLILQGFHYGLRRFATLDKETQIRHIKTAETRRLIKPQSDYQVNHFLSRIEAGLSKRKSEGNEALKETWKSQVDGEARSDFIELLDLAEINKEDQKKYIDQMVEANLSKKVFWKTLAGKKIISPKNIGKIQRVFSLSSFTQDHLPLVRKIVNHLKERERPILLQEIAKLNRKNWETLLTEDVGLPNGVDKQRYIGLLMRNSGSSFPTAALLRNLDLRNKKHRSFKVLLDKVPRFDFRNVSVKEFFTRHLENNEEVLKEILDIESGPIPEKSIQEFREDLIRRERLFSMLPSNLSNSSKTFQLLYQSGITSTTEVSRLPFSVFYERLGNGRISKEEALSIYQRARFIHQNRLNLMGKMLLLGEQEKLSVMPSYALSINENTSFHRSIALGEVSAPLTISNMKDWFQSLNYGPCKHCESVLSSGAYLVDLLGFLSNLTLPDGIEGFQNARDLFLDRRPDINNLNLSCENALTPLPYIDLVIEMLEQVVLNLNTEPQEGASIKVPISMDLQTSLPTPELKALPENTNTLVYKDYLKQENGRQGLPFDLWWEEASTYIKKVNVSFHDIRRTFLQDTTASNLASAYLGIPEVEWAIWTAVRRTGAQSLDLTKNLRPILPDPQEAYEKELALLQCNFVNPLYRSSIEDLRPSDRDRMDRFLRLQAALGWDTYDLDKALRTFRGLWAYEHNDYQKKLKDLYKKLYYTKKLQDTWEVPLLTLLSWWQKLDTAGKINDQSWVERPYKEVSSGQAIPSLYQQLFISQTVDNPAVAHFFLRDDARELDNTNHLLTEETIIPLVLGGVNLTAEELTIIIEAEELPYEYDRLSLANLSHLYRISTFCKYAEISIREYLSLKNLWKKHILWVLDSKVTWDFVENVLNPLKASPFTIGEIAFLLQHDLHWQSAMVPEKTDIEILLAELKKEIRQSWENAKKEWEAIDINDDENWDFLPHYQFIEEIGQENEESSLAEKRQTRNQLIRWVKYLLNLQLGDGKWLTQRLLAEFYALAADTSVLNINQALALLSFIDPLIPEETGENITIATLKDYLENNAKDEFIQHYSKILTDNTSWIDEVIAAMITLIYGLKNPGFSTEKSGAILAVFFEAFMDTTEAEARFGVRHSWAEADTKHKKEELIALQISRIYTSIRFLTLGSFIQQKLAESEALPLQSISLLIHRILRPTAESGFTSIIDVFWDEESFLLPEAAVEQESYPIPFNTYLKIRKAAILIHNLELFPEDLELLFGENTWFDLNALPIIHNSDADVSALFTALLTLLKAYRLNKNHFDPNLSLFDIVKNNKEADLDSFFEDLVKSTGWNLEDLKTFREIHEIDPLDSNENLITWLIKLEQAVAIQNKTGVSFRQLACWATIGLGASANSLGDAGGDCITGDDGEDIGDNERDILIARQIRNAVKARYEPRSWLEQAPEVRDLLRKKQRDALMTYIIHRSQATATNVSLLPTLENDYNLYEYYLLDPMMDPCMMTSRIKQAISSVQLFVQRLFMGLEVVNKNEDGIIQSFRVTSDKDKRQEWLWRKNYRVWEANRKVFLYPENWIEPDLRLNKTPFFADLENELLQNELNEEVAERAYLNYLRQLKEVSRLEIMAYHEEENGQTLHVVGRTHSIPHTYYYRKKLKNSWTPWKKIDLDIEGNHLLLTVFNRRVFLIWPIFEEKTIKETKEICKDANDKSSCEEVEISVRYFDIRLAWSEYFQGRWNGKRISMDTINGDYSESIRDKIKKEGYADFFELTKKEEVSEEPYDLSIEEVVDREVVGTDEKIYVKTYDRSKYKDLKAANRFMLTMSKHAYVQSVFSEDDKQLEVSFLNLSNDTLALMHSGIIDFSSRYRSVLIPDKFFYNPSENLFEKKSGGLGLWPLSASVRFYRENLNFDFINNKYLLGQSLLDILVELEYNNEPRIGVFETKYTPNLKKILFNHDVAYDQSSSKNLHFFCETPNDSFLIRGTLTPDWKTITYQNPVPPDPSQGVICFNPEDEAQMERVAEAIQGILDSLGHNPTTAIENFIRDNNREQEIPEGPEVDNPVIEEWTEEGGLDSTPYNTSGENNIILVQDVMDSVDSQADHDTASVSAISAIGSRISMNEYAAGNESIAIQIGQEFFNNIPSQSAPPFSNAPSDDDFRVYSLSSPQRMGAFSLNSCRENEGSLSYLKPSVNATFCLTLFQHPYTNLFLEQINRYGIDGLLDPKSIGPAVANANLFRQQINKELFGEYYEDPDHELGSLLPLLPIYEIDLNARTTNKGTENISCNFATVEGETPYSQYNWEIFFHIPFLMAAQLSRQQKFEAAQKWFHYIFDPTHHDPGVEGEGGAASKAYWKIKPFYDYDGNKHIEELLDIFESGDSAAKRKLLLQTLRWQDDPFNPHLLGAYRIVSYMKAVVIKYLDNLIAWGDYLFRRDTMESINEAAQYYVLAARLLGPKPVRAITWADPAMVKKVEDVISELMEDQAMNSLSDLLTISSDGISAEDSKLTILDTIFSAHFCIPPNEKILSYWEIIGDRLFKIRHCMNIEGVERMLRLFEPPIDPALLVRARTAGLDISTAINDFYAPLPHYRFSFLIQKAIEFCNDVKSLGAALLSTLEKKDAEGLALLQSRHQKQLFKLVKDVRKKQIKEAQENCNALGKAKDLATARKEHYESLEFMNNWEIAGMAMIGASAVLQGIGQIAKLLAPTVRQFPDSWAGSVGVFPTSLFATIGGSKIAETSKDYGDIWLIASSILSTGGSLSQTYASYKRREEEWNLQADLAIKEIEQIEKQILAADIRKQIAELELRNQERQIEQAKEVLDYYKTKFTNQQLYSWMSGQLSMVYFQAYQMAYTLARKAEKAFQHELGIENTRFIEFGYWDSRKKGLLAGDKLQKDLRRLELAFLEQNKREHELTKHFSLALLNPEKLLELREKGTCEFSIPELAFDLEYPGHYMRRIKSVSLSIPCITGPYASVSARLTLQRNRYRKNTSTSNGYAYSDINDDRFVLDLLSSQSIATSSAQNDSGLFELNFRDERYLPFERAGAISSWRLELPNEFRQFDYDTISDVIIHMKYTAREGRDVFKESVVEHVRTNINNWLDELAQTGEGLYRLVSLKHEFPTEFHQFLHPPSDQFFYQTKIKITDKLFPRFLRKRTISIEEINLGLKTTVNNLQAIVEDPNNPKEIKFSLEKVSSGNINTPYNSILLEFGQAIEGLFSHNYSITGSPDFELVIQINDQYIDDSDPAKPEEVIVDDLKKIPDGLVDDPASTPKRLKSEAIEDILLLIRYTI